VTGESASSESRELIVGAAALGVGIDTVLALKLVSHLDGVYRWNDYAGLTTVPRADALRLHILDSLSIAPDLEGCTTVVDLGSGAGFPGVPLAIAKPDSFFTLVEARSRRCSFLREMARSLGLSQAMRVVEADAHRFATDRPCDAVVSRAFLPPPELMKLGVSLLRPGGRLIVMAGGEPERATQLDEGADAVPGMTLRRERELVLPSGSERRRISVYEKHDGS
jgi:16S rRNA (guanine527-N7)-methyltransferase